MPRKELQGNEGEEESGRERQEESDGDNNGSGDSSSSGARRGCAGCGGGGVSRVCDAGALFNSYGCKSVGCTSNGVCGCKSCRLKYVFAQRRSLFGRLIKILLHRALDFLTGDGFDDGGLFVVLRDVLKAFFVLINDTLPRSLVAISTAVRDILVSLLGSIPLLGPVLVQLLKAFNGIVAGGGFLVLSSERLNGLGSGSGCRNL